MLRPIIVAFLIAALSGGCGSDGSAKDGGRDLARDYAKIEGPITNPIVDLPVRLDQGRADLPAADASAD
jgi:hypothetical protein